MLEEIEQFDIINYNDENLFHVEVGEKRMYVVYLKNDDVVIVADENQTLVIRTMFKILNIPYRPGNAPKISTIVHSNAGENVLIQINNRLT